MAQTEDDTMSRPTASLMLAALVSMTALAGCFQSNPESDDAVYSISRSYSVLINAETSRQMEGADGPEEFVRRLVDSSLVIRVGDAGDYSLRYTDEDGNERTESLAGLAPGTARTVEGVDPFTAATLTRGAETVATRGPVSQTWWDIGVPLGVRASAPASAVYDFTSFSSLELQLEDIQSEDGNMTLDSLLARLTLPVEGTLKWNLVDEGAEDRLQLNGDIKVDDTRGSLFLVDAKGTLEGEAIEVGTEVVSGGASADGGVAIWLKDGQVIAGQFLGGAAHADPEVYAWGTGLPEGAEEEFSCAGSARADRCQPEEIEGFDESEPAGEREAVPEDQFDIDDEDDREAVQLLEKLFAQDLALYDSFTLTAEFSSEDAGDETNEYSMRYVQELSVAARETVQVPAGSFDALRIVQSARIVVDADHVESSNCETYGEYPDYGCAEWSNGTIVQDLSIDETLVRTTLWLDSASYQPLKGEVIAPIDLGAVVRRALGSLGDEFWNGLEVEAFDAEDIELTANSESSFVASTLSGDAKFAPYVGLLLGSMMNGGAGGAMSPAMMAPWGMGMGMGGPMMPTPYPEPYPAYPDYTYPDPSDPYPTYPMTTPPPTWMTPTTPREPVSLSISSMGPVVDGAKTYVVEGVSGDLTWGDLGMDVDGYYRGVAYEADCAGGAEYEFVACNGDVPETYEDSVDAGDTIRLTHVESGQTPRVIDSWTNSVILVVTIE